MSVRYLLLPLCLTASFVACEATSTNEDAAADAGDFGDTDASADGSGDALPDPLSMPDWCQDSNQLWCDWMFECFSDADMTTARQTFGFDDTVESCLQVAVASCQNRTIPAVNDGRQIFDGVEAALCVNALANEPCAGYEELADGIAFDPPACSDVSVGTREFTETCQGNNDCAAENARCIEGLCTGRLERNSYLASCDPSQVTANLSCPGLLCLAIDPDDRTAGICTHACTLDEHCGEGASCFRDNSGDRFCLANCDTNADCGQFECVQASPDQFACITN